jgi:hypothetical protein
MTSTPSSAPSAVLTKRIKRIAPLQLGKMSAVLHGIMAVIFVPFMLLSFLFTPDVPAGNRVGFMAFTAGFGLLMPVFYAVMGFVAGVVGAFVYNVVAKWIGGIEIELE